MRTYIDKLIEQYGEDELTPLRVEKGVYVFDFNVDEKVSKQKRTAARDLNPSEVGGSSASDGPATNPPTAPPQGRLKA
eukprot:2887376-Karenia_brevis.AAC.1